MTHGVVAAFKSGHRCARYGFPRRACPFEDDRSSGGGSPTLPGRDAPPTDTAPRIERDQEKPIEDQVLDILGELDKVKKIVPDKPPTTTVPPPTWAPPARRPPPKTVGAPIPHQPARRPVYGGRPGYRPGIPVPVPSGPTGETHAFTKSLIADPQLHRETQGVRTPEPTKVPVADPRTTRNNRRRAAARAAVLTFAAAYIASQKQSFVPQTGLNNTARGHFVDQVLADQALASEQRGSVPTFSRPRPSSSRDRGREWPPPPVFIPPMRRPSGAGRGGFHYDLWNRIGREGARLR